MIMFLSIMFLGSVQPLMMVVSLMMITFLYSFYIYFIMGSYWFSYALIMVMLSGVFVIFIYMSSMIPNEGFEVYSMIFLVVLMFMGILNEEFSVGELVLEFVSLKMWMMWYGMMVLYLVGMLFGVMLMVVWLSCKNKGALRVG